MPWSKGMPSPNPGGVPPGKRGRQLAALLREAFNAPQYRDDPKKVIAERAVEALMTGYIVFEESKMVNGKIKWVEKKQKVNPKNWIDLYKFVNNHLDGGAKIEIEMSHGEGDEKPFTLPADMIASSFVDLNRDITQRLHTEYVIYGGRGSTKSSFISEKIIELIKNNPLMHALATRQVANTLRQSVYAQLQWAIDELGLSDEFKCTVSPLEIRYLRTGQTIYFRGADDPGKIKSIKPPFGYIGILWLEELDQFHGQEAVRKIEQSVIRGGDDAFIFKSFNPPPTANNWANKYTLIPKDTQYQHKSDYRSVPVEWLGRTWLEEAEHLKNTNPAAYDNEYLGLPNNDGGMVFTNVVIRPISDDEIKEFDRVLHGLDFGFYPDPASYGKMHYDAARRTLYIFGEARYWKKSNEALYKALTATEYGLLTNDDMLIADSAEPKSVADFRAYGSNCRGAEKGKESVKYSYKWLQGLTAIVIDNVRAPYHAEEFLDCEYERTKDDEIISEFPNRNNHAIDDTRYGTNLIWRRRGE
jgi:phage terminase large subunit